MCDSTLGIASTACFACFFCQFVSTTTHRTHSLLAVHLFDLILDRPINEKLPNDRGGDVTHVSFEFSAMHRLISFYFPFQNVTYVCIYTGNLYSILRGHGMGVASVARDTPRFLNLLYIFFKIRAKPSLHVKPSSFLTGPIHETVFYTTVCE